MGNSQYGHYLTNSKPASSVDLETFVGKRAEIVCIPKETYFNSFRSDTYDGVISLLIYDGEVITSTINAFTSGDNVVPTNANGRISTIEIITHKKPSPGLIWGSWVETTHELNIVFESAQCFSVCVDREFRVLDGYPKGIIDAARPSGI